MTNQNLIGDRIKRARENKNLSLKELGDLLGLSSATISRYENGIVANIKLPILQSIAEELGVDVLWLIGKSDKMVSQINDRSLRRVPLIGTIAAGTPVLAEENIEDYFGLDHRIKADFCLRITGDSMIGEGIHHDDIVFIKQQPDVENGEIAAVIINGEATLKRVIKANGTLILQPANPKYETLVISTGNVWIAGKLMAVLNIKA